MWGRASNDVDRSVSGFSAREPATNPPREPPMSEKDMIFEEDDGFNLIVDDARHDDGPSVDDRGGDSSFVFDLEDLAIVGKERTIPFALARNDSVSFLN
jgi:hypothetical protein